MAAGTTPIFIDGVKTWTAVASVANTLFDGTGTIVDITDGLDVDGDLIEFIDVSCTATTAAALLANFFIHNGTAWRFWQSVVLAIATVSTTVPPASGSVSELVLPLGLQTAYKLGFAPTTGTTIYAVVRGGTY